MAPFWTAGGQTVTGASHLRRGQPNQDSLAIDEPEGARIVAVADGHGSARCFRSERGARLATRLAVALLREALDAGSDGLARRLTGQVPRELVRRWRDAVAADFRKNPFADRELDRAAEKSPTGTTEVVLDPALAYGATLLAVLATEEFVFYLQLGDGDILAVAEDGAVWRPIPRDPDLVANETTSLCMREAVRHVRVRLEPAAPRLPALVMVSTDGYANSYASDEAFQRVGSDYVRLIQDDGFESVTARLEEWLSEVTAKASGDDITVALLFRPSALAPQRPLSLRRDADGWSDTVHEPETWLMKVEHGTAPSVRGGAGPASGRQAGAVDEGETERDPVHPHDGPSRDRSLRPGGPGAESDAARPAGGERPDAPPRASEAQDPVPDPPDPRSAEENGSPDALRGESVAREAPPHLPDATSGGIDTGRAPAADAGRGDGHDQPVAEEGAGATSRTPQAALAGAPAAARATVADAAASVAEHDGKAVTPEGGRGDVHGGTPVIPQPPPYRPRKLLGKLYESRPGWKERLGLKGGDDG